MSQFGPDRQSDAYPPGPDPAEVRELRGHPFQIETTTGVPVEFEGEFFLPLGPEQFEGYDEWASAYEVFGEDLERD